MITINQITDIIEVADESVFISLYFLKQEKHLTINAKHLYDILNEGIKAMSAEISKDYTKEELVKEIGVVFKSKLLPLLTKANSLDIKTNIWLSGYTNKMEISMYESKELYKSLK